MVLVFLSHRGLLISTKGGNLELFYANVTIDLKCMHDFIKAT